MAQALVEVASFAVALLGGDMLCRAVKVVLGIRLASEVEGANSGATRLSVAIGYLERALVFLLAFNGHPEALGWIFAAKSIARFRELESRRFTEYYLIGTLASIFWALLCALAAKRLIATSFG